MSYDDGAASFGRREGVEFVRLPDVLGALKLSFDQARAAPRVAQQSLSRMHVQFVDVCLLAGYGRCRTFPPALDHKARRPLGQANVRASPAHQLRTAQRRFSFERCLDIVRSFGSGGGVALRPPHAG